MSSIIQFYILKIISNVEYFANHRTNISCAVEAYATLDHKRPDLFAKIIPCVLEQIHRFKSQELSNLLWGFAKMRSSSQRVAPLFEAARQTLLAEPLSRHSSQALVNISYSMVKVGAIVPDLLSAVSSQLSSRIADDKRGIALKPQELANMCWALAKVPSAPFTSRELQCCQKSDATIDFLHFCC